MGATCCSARQTAKPERSMSPPLKSDQLPRPSLPLSTPAHLPRSSGCLLSPSAKPHFVRPPPQSSAAACFAPISSYQHPTNVPSHVSSQCCPHPPSQVHRGSDSLLYLYLPPLPSPPHTFPPAFFRQTTNRPSTGLPCLSRSSSFLLLSSPPLLVITSLRPSLGHFIQFHESFVV